MQSIQSSFGSFSKKRVMHYDHYDRYNHYNMTFDHPPHKSRSSSSSRRPMMPGAFEFEPATPPPLTSDPSFEILDWHPAYQSCQRFFLDHAQHEPATQALCALVNIRLPFQYTTNPIESAISLNASARGPAASSTHSFHYPRSGNSPPNPSHGSPSREPSVFVSLIPYVKRLVVTGFDKPAILHGLFGDDWRRGIIPHLDCERRNYLFAAKHGGWSCKSQYDKGSGMGGDESVPFMKPLEEAKLEELTAAEKAWSGWLAMEDWMVGPNAPKDDIGLARSPPRHSREDSEAQSNATEVLPNGVDAAFEQQNGVHVNGDAAASVENEVSEET